MKRIVYFTVVCCASHSAGGGSRVHQTIIQPNPLRLSLWSSMKSQAVFSQSLLLFCFLRQTGATSSPAHPVSIYSGLSVLTSVLRQVSAASLQHHKEDYCIYFFFKCIRNLAVQLAFFLDFMHLSTRCGSPEPPYHNKIPSVSLGCL